VRAGRRPRRKRRLATEGVGAASSFSSGYPSLTGLNPIVPVAAGLLGGLVVGLINGSFIAYTKIPPFIATLGMMVSARGVADWYTNGQPIGNLTDSFAAIGAGWWPVIIFLAVAAIFHIALRYTRYGKFTYALAGLFSGLCGVVHTARAISEQAGVGVGFELDAIAAAVIGGTSLSGGVGRLTRTVIGAVILGMLTSGFTFRNVDAHYQEIIKGAVIIAAVVADRYRQRRRRSEPRGLRLRRDFCWTASTAPCLPASIAHLLVRWARKRSAGQPHMKL